MKRRLFGHESELQSLGSLTLTTHRVIHQQSQNGVESSTSILLQHVQYTRVARSHRPLWLVMSGGMLALGLLSTATGAKPLFPGFLVAAVVFALIYAVTRRAVLSVASGGGRIELGVDPGRASRERVRDFLDAIDGVAALVPRERAQVIATP